MGEPRRSGAFNPLPPELQRHPLGLPGRAGEVRVQPIEKFRPRGGQRLTRPELPDLGFAENIIPRKHLIRPLAGEHGLYAGITDELRQQIERGRGGTEDGTFRVPDDLREHARDITARDHQLLVIAVDRRRHRALELRLIVLRVLEADGVGPENPFFRLPAHPCGDRTVEAA